MNDTMRFARETLIDMRCSASLQRPLADQGRCQLLAGHHCEHAVMFGGPVTRLVVAWSATCDTHAVTDDWRSRPWMRGFPFPAWFEKITPPN